MTTSGSALDTAIIGGGVSGLYTAWRLASDATTAGSNIGVFEASDRIGGRLWSVCLKDEHAVPAELGGMFFSDAQDLVYRLCGDVLGLKLQAVTPRDDFAWLRGKRFMMADFAGSGVPPYNLAEDERGLEPHELLLLVVKRIAPDITHYWPLNPKSTMAGTVDYLRSVQYGGRPLHAWGFWNLMAQVVSNEARLCLADVEGSYALFSNWNGYDAVFSILSDLTGRWYRLPDGYQHLPECLRDHAEKAGVRVHAEHELVAVRAPDADGFHILEFSGGLPEVRARRVVLALPSGAIERIHLEWSGSMGENLASSAGVPASKIFMVFDTPWWQDVPEGPGRIEAGSFAASHTDLPMRQCYYLGVDPDTGDGLVLGSFGDTRSVDFWPPLMSADGRGARLTRSLNAVATAELCRQLSEMHGITVPEPVDGIFVDWACTPYYGGWHAWQPGWQSWEASKTLRGRTSGPGIHVCGEAYSAYQGWVEGALTSAEMMLRDVFGLATPEWLSDSECLVPYRV